MYALTDDNEREWERPGKLIKKFRCSGECGICELSICHSNCFLLLDDDSREASVHHVYSIILTEMLEQLFMEMTSPC